jgi:peptidoglycan-N-acetylglucosamine deacetylase
VGKAYLTVDDGPSGDFPNKVKFLRSKGIPATFFCRGDLLDRRPDEAVEAIRQGFVIGNHSYDHPHFSKMSLDKVLQQIRQTDWVIERIYEKAGVKRPAKLFRFPYGDRGAGRKVDEAWPEFARPLDGTGAKELEKFLKSSGYVEVPWTFDVLEWSTFKGNHGLSVKNLRDVLARIDGLFNRAGPETILVHDHPETSGLFTPIIEKFLELGVEFEPLPQI